MSLSPRTQITSQPPTTREDAVLSGPRRKRTRKPLRPAEEVQPRKRTHRDAQPKQEETPAKRGREWREPWLGKGIRRAELSPTLFQLRVRVGPLKNDAANFGLYPSPGEARRISKLVNKGRARGEYIWDTLVRLQAEGEVKPKILPRWVYRRPDGLFGARVRQGPRKGEELKTPVGSPVLAHDLFREQLGLPRLAGWKPRPA